MTIRWCHVNAEHAGRGITLNELRQRGFFIINGNSRDVMLYQSVWYVDDFEVNLVNGKWLHFLQID